MIAPTAAWAVQPAALSGAITGVVRDSSGLPQMGAAVVLLSHQERVLGRVLTDEHGEFKLLGLLPNLYSVKVSLTSFVPAIKKNILVQPGMRSVLNVSLNTLFSSIQLSYPTLDNGSIMSDDWKWVLRSSSPTRPVMRLVEVEDAAADPMSPNAGEKTRTAMFSGTRGIVRVAAGGNGYTDLTGNQSSMGTSFALATSVYGSNNLQLSGNVGYGSQTGAPTTAFRTSYSRSLAGGSPELSVTMRQMYLPGRFASIFSGQDSAMPGLRTMSASLDDHTQIGDNLTIQYGFALDCVSFLDRLNYLSPYARLSYDLGNGSEIEFAYTSGNARPNLGGAGEDEDLQRNLNNLGIFPKVSMLSGQTKVQRGQEYEIGYSHTAGSRIYQVSAYRESVSNLALSMVSPAAFFSGSDILPDLFSGNSIFNAGNYDSVGYTVAVTQTLGDHVTATAIYGSTGALTTEGHELVSNSPDDLRNMIRVGRRHAATTRVAATVPWTGTHLVASYQWAAGGDQRWVEPGNLYSTRSLRAMPGLNVYVRQPIPGFGGRIEATADLRNLLAQGYLGLNTLQNQRVLLVENPRSVRGGLSFIF